MAIGQDWVGFFMPEPDSRVFTHYLNLAHLINRFLKKLQTRPVGLHGPRGPRPTVSELIKSHGPIRPNH